MKNLFHGLCFLLSAILLTGVAAEAQVVPEAVKVDKYGRTLPSVERLAFWNDVKVDSVRNVFPTPTCLPGEYYIGFQLFYDLGDQNTTANWTAHLELTLTQGATTLFTNKPLDIQMANQTFVSTIFYTTQALACNYNITYKATAKSFTGTLPTGNIRLKILLFRKHADDFNPASTLTLNCPNSNGQTDLGWSYSGNSATEYDVEWVFIANYEGFTGTTGQDAFNFKAGAGITTAASYYTHPTFYPTGKVYYRVRAVGYRDLNPDHRILGQWFYTPCNTNPPSITNPQANMTWQSQTLYSSDGKYKREVKYYDPTMRQRQTQVNLSSSSNTIIGEAMYDFEGRPSVATLPVPNYGTQMTYQQSLNSFNAVDPLVISKTNSYRKKFHYDNGRAENGPMSNMSGAGNYYSSMNWLDGPLRNYIPNANGYVYSQKEYMRDGTNSVTRESDPGWIFRMDDIRTTRNYYGQASPTELIRLFGTNVGNASHYKKQITVDKNGQVGVTYQDQEGRTIATALAGNSPFNVEALDSFVPAGTSITVDVSSKTKTTPRSLVTTHKILNEVPGTTYTFEYTLSALGKLVEGFPNCYGCTYDLTISIADPDGKPVMMSGLAGNQSTDGQNYQRKNITAASCQSATTINDINFQREFSELGDYTLTKTLTPVLPSYEAVKTIVLSTPSVTTLINELPNEYVLNPAECTTCSAAPACPEAYQALELAEQEISDAECVGILNQIIQLIREDHPLDPYYKPSETEITGHELHCKYLRCKDNAKSDAFDKHLGRIPTWNGASSAGYAPTTPGQDNKTMLLDPFFGVGGLGASYKGTMQGFLNTSTIGAVDYDSDNDGLSNGVRTLSGSIDDITDPYNTTYYVNDNMMQDARGKHVLYFDLMSNKTQTGYAKKLDEARWTMYRAFYLEAKRKAKLAVTEIYNCVKLREELQLSAGLPTSTGGITTYASQNGLPLTVTTDEINGTLAMINDRCNITLSSTDRATIGAKLTTYFLSSSLNFLRFVISEDVGVNQNLIDINAILLGYGCNIATVARPNPLKCNAKVKIGYGPNYVKNSTLIRNGGCSSYDISTGCFADWTTVSGTPQATPNNELFLTSNSCNGSSAVRGTLLSPLVPQQLYRFTFKYKSVSGLYNGGFYSGGTDNLNIQLTGISGTFTPGACPACTYTAPPTNNPANEGSDPWPPGSSPNPYVPPCPPSGCPHDVFLAQPGCTLPFANSPHAVKVDGQQVNYLYSLSQSANLDYVEVTVYFVPQSASTNFYVSVFNQSGGTSGTLFRDFKIQEAREVCVNYEPIDPKFKFNIDWNAVTTSCNDRAQDERNRLIAFATERIVESNISKFYANYNCLAGPTETLKYTYQSREYHYTLFYYDQAGNLVQTVPPKGVVPLTTVQLQNFPGSGNPAHSLASTYTYDSFERVKTQTSPDAGTTEFWFNNKGELRMSRNAQEAATQGTKKYSYNKYDALGRLKETGQLTTPTLEPTGVQAIIEDPTFPLQASNTLSDITWTYYDTPDAAIQAQFPQENLRNRISYTEVTDQSNLPGNANNIRTYFSYDILGNIKALRQQIPGLTPKKVNYVYDEVTNKIRYVFFQFGDTDQFVHRYLYDGDNRITGVYTSADRFIWHKDAGYSYYNHGPLARTELGEYVVQGQDYYYTVQGWLKGMNMPFANDPSKDGEGGSAVGKDAAAFTLGYFQGDYAPSGPLAGPVPVIADTRDWLWDRTETLTGHRGLYNGNISWMITDLAKQGDLQGDRAKGMQAMVYKFDQLQRLKKSYSLTSYINGGGFAHRTTTPAAYDELFTYDPNGNFVTLSRRSETGAIKDNFSYQYYPLSNRLMEVHPVVNDLVISSGVVATTNVLYRNLTIQGTATIAAGSNVHLKATQSIKISPTVTVPQTSTFRAQIVTNEGTYQYDANGSLVLDQENGVAVSWTPKGNVRQVSVGSNSVSTFRYDALGFRVEKKVVSGSTTTITRYVRDPDGNILAVYNDTQLTEQPIYGLARLGQYIGGSQEGKTTNGQRQYEIANHLGNVLSVINDKVSMNAGVVTATALSTADYYPFGSAMAGRTWKDPSLSYRYGYNGQEKDTEIGEGIYSAEYWEYDGRLARRWNVDPVVDPTQSPYAAFNNNPIAFNDPKGDCTDCPDEEVGSKYLGKVDISLGSFGNGIVDGFVGALPDIAGFAWDMITSENARDEFVTGMTTLLKDPIGSVKALAADKYELWSSILNGKGTEQQKYEVGKEIGNFLFGVATGAGAAAKISEILKVAKFEKKLLKLADEADKLHPKRAGLTPQVRGTNIHTDFENLLRRNGADGKTELSYRDRNTADRGERGTSRADVIYGSSKKPKIAYDLKTGVTGMSNSQLRKYGRNLPKGTTIKQIIKDSNTGKYRIEKMKVK